MMKYREKTANFGLDAPLFLFGCRFVWLHGLLLLYQDWDFFKSWNLSIIWSCLFWLLEEPLTHGSRLDVQDSTTSGLTYCTSYASLEMSKWDSGWGDPFFWAGLCQKLKWTYWTIIWIQIFWDFSVTTTKTLCRYCLQASNTMRLNGKRDAVWRDKLNVGKKCYTSMEGIL